MSKPDLGGFYIRYLKISNFSSAHKLNAHMHMPYLCNCFSDKIIIPKAEVTVTASLLGSWEI